MIGEHAEATVVGGRLRELARAWNVAAADVEPITRHAPFWNFCHRLCLLLGNGCRESDLSVSIAIRSCASRPEIELRVRLVGAGMRLNLFAPGPGRSDAD